MSPVDTTFIDVQEEGEIKMYEVKLEYILNVEYKNCKGNLTLYCTVRSSEFPLLQQKLDLCKGIMNIQIWFKICPYKHQNFNAKKLLCKCFIFFSTFYKILELHFYMFYPVNFKLDFLDLKCYLHNRFEYGTITFLFIRSNLENKWGKGYILKRNIN